MNVAMACVQLITICIAGYYEYRKGSISMFLWATLLLLFGIPHFIGVLFATYDYDSSVMIQASLFVALFNIIYLLFRITILGRKRALDFRNEFKRKVYGLKTAKSKRLICVLFMCLVASLAILVYLSVSLFGGLLATSWGGFRSLPGSVYSLNKFVFAKLISMHLLFVSGGVIIPLWLTKRRYSSIACMLIIVCHVLITRKRIEILPLFVALVLLYASKKRKIGPRQLIAFAMIMICVVFTVDGLRLYRHYGTLAKFRENFDIIDFNQQILQMITSDEGELGLRNAFYYFLAEENKFPDFGEAHTYIRLLLIAVPTKYSLGLKPGDFAISMGSAYINNFSNTSYSVHPTLYGDCYANLGWLGVLLGIFWAFFAFVIDKLANRKNLVVKSALMVLFGAMYVIIGRGSVYNGCYLAFISALFLLVLNVALTAANVKNVCLQRASQHLS